MDSVGKLEEAALKRKARLEELKRKRQGGGKENKDEGNDAKLPKAQALFRNYQPKDEALQEGVLPAAEPGEVKEKVREELQVQDEGLVVEELDFTNLAPRKPDWDLKRDIAKKLAKLERRTQRAIAELIRDRLKEEDLANAVTAGAAKAANQDDDDD